MNNIGAAQIESIFRSDSLFVDLKIEEIRELARYARHVRFRTGEAAFTTDMTGTQIFFLVEGRFRITGSNLAGKELLFAMVEPGGHFGEIAVIDGGARGVNAIADRPSYALTIERDHLMPVLEGNAKAALTLARLVCFHLRESMANALNLALGDTPMRVWGRLMYLSHHYGQPNSENGALRIEHGLSQQSLADSVGLTRVMINRQLGAWRELELIEDGRGYIVIPDPVALSNHVWRGVDPDVDVNDT